MARASNEQVARNLQDAPELDPWRQRYCTGCSADLDKTDAAKRWRAAGDDFCSRKCCEKWLAPRVKA